MNAHKLEYEVVQGVPSEYRSAAGELYDEAFGEKISLAIPNRLSRIQLYDKYFDLNYALAAVRDDALLGIAGFSTPTGSLTSKIDYRGLLSELGLLTGNRAALVLSFYERRAAAGELLMDGISVGADYRGAGVGRRLLSEVINFAKQEQYSTIRLDVIDTNKGAKKLYERVGFTSTKTEEFEFLRGVLGFGGSTAMHYEITHKDAS